MRKTVLTIALAGILIASARGQGFLNLDFESAGGLPGNPGGGTLVSVTNAFPDWVAFDGSLALSGAYYASNSFSGAGTSVELEGGSLALNGNFSAELFNGGSISQTGLVPGDAESLEFEAYGLSGASGFSLTLGGQKLSYSTLSQGPNYNVYGANIPAGMDGQAEALTLACQGVGSGLVRLDNIQFSTLSVPEPAEWALTGLGTILVGLRYRHKRARPVN